MFCMLDQLVIPHVMLPTLVQWPGKYITPDVFVPSALGPVNADS